MDIIESLNWRYATKRFDDSKKLSAEKLNKILEALRLSPSSYGLQAMKFVVVEDPAIREELKQHAWNQPQITEASQLIVLCRTTSINEADVDEYANLIAETRKIPVEALSEFVGMMKGSVSGLDEEAKAHWLAKQVYIALGNLMTACAIEEVDSCPMEGFDSEAFDKILGLEEKGLKSVVLAPIGYRSAEDVYQQLPKVRKPFQEVIIQK